MARRIARGLSQFETEHINERDERCETTHPSRTRVYEESKSCASCAEVAVTSEQEADDWLSVLSRIDAARTSYTKTWCSLDTSPTE